IPNMKKAFTKLLQDFSTASGSISNCKTTLNWTSKDVSAMRYEVERKVFGEANYSKVADVLARPNVFVLANHSYQQTDTLLNAQAGTVSYRIRQIIDTTAVGFTAAYTDTIDLSLSNSCIATANPVNTAAAKIKLIPNPAINRFTLRIETPYPVNYLNIYILDMTGRRVSLFARSKSSGRTDFNLPISALAKGKYIVAVYNATQLLASTELIKL
ncbi:MAG TPA: T9SS type A sorting domain-containing protein, partial [Chitinophagaceae bacterium]|nr:T9SS type A sorting domain-containing protein [Chitinophagaceae bacterium]